MHWRARPGWWRGGLAQESSRDAGHGSRHWCGGSQELTPSKGPTCPDVAHARAELDPKRTSPKSPFQNDRVAEVERARASVARRAGAAGFYPGKRGRRRDAKSKPTAGSGRSEMWSETLARCGGSAASQATALLRLHASLIPSGPHAFPTVPQNGRSPPSRVIHGGRVDGDRATAARPQPRT